MTYRHSKDMGEITGVSRNGPAGMVYENTCQTMLEAGVEWIVAHPEFEFAASGYQDVQGMLYAENLGTQELLKTIIAAVDEDADGAQVHAVMLRLDYISLHGWNAYVERCKTAQAEKAKQLQ